jgi:energy-coupling factor transport system ATP-binding protein
MENPKPVIEIDNLTFTYSIGDKPALKHISLTIYEGEYVALLGLNGAGKTTLQLCLNAVIPHMIVGEKEGTVKINGMDTEDYPPRELAKVIGLVFDNPEFQLSQMSVAEEIALGLENLGIPTENMGAIIKDSLQAVGLSGMEDRSPFELSGGQQQRLSIASALAMQPRILVMDEPTSNVDPIGKEEVFAVAEKLNKENKITIIMAEHEVEVMAAYADRIIVMNEGEVILNGTPVEVFSNVEMLEKIGLRVPQVTELIHLLKQKHKLKLADEYPVTVDQAEGVFMKRLS